MVLLSVHMLRVHPSLPSGLMVMLLLVAVPASAGGSHEHKYGYGDVPGNPLVQEDAARCLEATKDDPSRSCIVLYGHIFNLLDPFLSNTQRPPAGTPDLARGFSTTPAIEPWFDLNELEMYSSPGFVEYQEDPTLPPSMIHRENGITKDVTLATEVPVTGYWHLSVDLDELGENDPQEVDIGAKPCVTVQMALATGRVFSPENVIARGATTKTMVNADPAAQDDADPLAAAPCPGSREGDIMRPETMTEFEVDMGLPVKDVIPKLKAFVVFVEWYVHAPGDPDNADKISGHGFNIHTGADAPNRVVVAIEDAVRIEELKVAPFDGRLFVRAVANSPWGSYDVDPTSLAFTVTDADGVEVPVRHVEAPHLRYDTTHAGHFHPVAITWPWDYRAEGLAPGTYTITVTVQNWQHTAEASMSQDVIIQPERVEVLENVPEAPPEPVPRESPGPWALALLALVGVAAHRARRTP